jgi:flavin reductase (DIM6/NTAB) family NADH-FMN oxidoreductase RutF
LGNTVDFEGVTIHASNPFATPDDQRSPVRRLRGRLPSPVTVWTAGSGHGRAGLTVSSMLVVDGEPGRVLGMISDEADLWTSIEETQRFAVIQLGTEDRLLADRFAGLLPAPGGPFRVGRWEQTDYGPVPAELVAGSRLQAAPVPGSQSPSAKSVDSDVDTESAGRTWAGCRLDSARPYGWGLLVEASIEAITFGPLADALSHVGGRYQTIPLD